MWNIPAKPGKHGKVILIPTDFSPICENAVNHGIELARNLGLKVILLHVKGEPDSQQGFFSIPSNELEKEVSKYRQVAEAGTEVKMEILFREGSLLKVINKVAREVKAGIMILGTPGKKGLQHLFGSNALKVVLDAPCPVIVVQQRSFGTGYRKIVIPVSNDLEPGPALEWALVMHRIFGSMMFLFQSADTEETSIHRKKQTMQKITESFDKEEISFVSDVANHEPGFPAQLVTYAALNQCDLIITSTMPHDEIQGFNLTEWNEQLMFNSLQIPVMCVNPGE